MTRPASWSPEAWETSRQIAEMLGLVIKRVRRDDLPGIVAETTLPSASRGNRNYRMLQSVSGAWMHADLNPLCEGWLFAQHCRHVDQLERTFPMVTEEEEKALVVQTTPLALLGQVTVDDVLKGFEPQSEWRYSFKRKGQEIVGLSVDGVQDGVRQMSRLGEAIRTLEVRLEHEDEKNAYFTARAARYAVQGDGTEVLLDTTIRGKRVSKYEARADGSGDYFNESWFEHGVTKAARNAEEALMPEALKQWMLAQAAEALPAGTEPPKERKRAASPRREKAAAEADERKKAEDLARQAWTEFAKTADADLQKERMGLLKARFPLSPNGQVMFSQMSADQLAEAITLIREGEPVPAGAPADCDHDWVFNEEADALVCTKCGTVEEPVEAPA